MFKLPQLGLFVTVFKAGVVVGVFVGAAAGALAGAVGGLLTAPTSGKKLRDKLKEDAEKGVQTISENGEKLKEQGRVLVDKISTQFETFANNNNVQASGEVDVETDEPLSEDEHFSSKKDGSKNGSKHRRSA